MTARTTAKPSALKRLDDLERKLDEDLGRLSARIRDQNTELQKLRRLCDGETLEKARRDARQIHELYQVAVLKMSVATEMTWLAEKNPGLSRALAQACIQAFERDNDWWVEREDQSLKAWMVELSAIARAT
mgnify:CR=1 FL=1